MFEVLPLNAATRLDPSEKFRLNCTMQKARCQRPLALAAGAVLAIAQFAWAQGGGLPGPHHYQLIEGSTLVQDCMVCAPSFLEQPLRGGFVLELAESNPLFTTYKVSALSFSTGKGSAPFFLIEGTGTYRIGGEVALRQTMELDLTINGRKTGMTNSTAQPGRRWPMIGVSLVETQRNTIQATLHLAAAPMHELWFSTAHGFTPADPNRPRGTAGDLLSSSGRVVRSAHELLQRLGLMPPTPALGIDAFDVALGGDVLFSLNESTFSETMGAIQHGDLLSETGQRLFLNQQLMAPFGLVFNALDLGLDALHVRDDGEVLFSITMDMDSPKAGPLHRGDLLSNRGVKVSSYEQLLSQFHPLDAKDYGLDAVYVWPSGEVWFSTEDGFQDRELGAIQHGDLLSDQGYIVIRNLDLLGPFQPVEDLADFGLDGLYVVTDAIEPARAPVLKAPMFRANDGSVTLQWSGAGRVFQLLKARFITGPWHAASPIVPGHVYVDFQVPADDPMAYYQLMQW